MTYSELIEKLQAAEKATGLYLSDTAVDLENAADSSDYSLFAAAASAAGDRAAEAGFDINELVGASIY